MKNFISNESGLETVEYAILVGMIVAGLIATVAAIGAWTKGEMDNLKTNIGA
jgi:Flp pilus assembly pilin Flp